MVGIRRSSGISRSRSKSLSALMSISIRPPRKVHCVQVPDHPRGVAEFDLDFSIADPVERELYGVALPGLHALLDGDLGHEGHSAVVHRLDATGDVLTLEHVDLDHPATGAVPVTGFGQRTPDAGRGHLKVIR